MTTGARGEGYLELEGESYVVLFTNRALADAERATGKTVMQLMAAAQGNAIGMGDVAHLLAVGLEYARREHRNRTGGYTANDAWRLLDQLGFATVAAVVLEALAAVMSYRPGPGKEDASPPG